MYSNRFAIKTAMSVIQRPRILAVGCFCLPDCVDFPQPKSLLCQAVRGACGQTTNVCRNCRHLSQFHLLGQFCERNQGIIYPEEMKNSNFSFLEAEPCHPPPLHDAADGLSLEAELPEKAARSLQSSLKPVNAALLPSVGS